MKLKIFFCAALLFEVSAVFLGCNSFPDSKSPSAEDVYSTPDYSVIDSVKTEISRIEEIRTTKKLKALWRSLLLCKDLNVAENAELFQLASAEYNSILKETVSLYAKAYEEKDYINAFRIYSSLQTCGYEKLAELPADCEKLTELIRKDVPGLSEQKKALEEKAFIPDLIKGTVTIVVDKGIKIERGMGFSDGVLGSGFFISKDGYIVTNNHVINDIVDPKYEGYSRLYIKLAEDPDTRIPAKVIGWDKTLDLALLKAEVDAPYVFTLGSSDDLDVGTKVFAIGSPLGLERTLTSGIISAKDRQFFTIGNVFQVDAAVNSGNSGGPLIDEAGNVQAIVFAGVQNYQGLNFAIPVEYLKYELPYLYKGGERKHIWTEANGKTKRLPGSGAKNEGIVVNYVMPGGSAYRSGIREGDVIIKFDGKDIFSIEEIQCSFMSLVPDMIKSVLVKDNEGVETERIIYLEERPKNPGYEIYRHDVIAFALYPILGMELMPVSTTSKRKYTIVKILKGSVADESGFSERDLVDVQRIQFNDEKTAAFIELHTKKRKSGYMDVNIGLQATLDNPYYF